MYTRKPSKLNTFGSDERGAVAMTFGLMMMGLLFLAGMAVDYTRAMNVRSRIADAADSAALAAGRALLDGKMSVSEIKELATNFFNQNVKSIAGQAKIDTPVINVDPVTGAVTVDVKSHVNMTLARLGGFETLDFPISTAVNFAQKDIEVGMALDITGSMDRAPAAGGDKKIVSLKNAFEKFAERLLPDDVSGDRNVRIAVAPYSSGLNLGSFAAAASLNRSKDGCVTERKDGQSSDDVAPFNVAADGIKDTDPTEGNVNNNSYECPKAEIVPLSDDREALVKEVKKFKAQGWTSGHLGTQWAWNLISNNWNWGSDSAPSDYSLVQNGKLMKAVVLMTDGTFNTAYNNKKSSDQAIALCNAMKEKGVVVFAVAFDATPAAQQTLRACATAGDAADEYYVNAADGDQLEKAFLKFASKISDLRITK